MTTATRFGQAVRVRHPLTAEVRATVEPIEGPFGLAKVRVRVENHSVWMGETTVRDEVVRQALVAVHVLVYGRRRRLHLAARPARVRQARVQSCQHQGLCPVLAAPTAPASSSSARRSSSTTTRRSRRRAPWRCSTPRDRRDPGPAGDDPHRRGEARGPRHRPTVGRDHRPDRQHAAGDLRAAPRRHRSLRPHRPTRSTARARARSTTSRHRRSHRGAVVGPGVDGAVDPWSDTTFIDGVMVQRGTGCSCAPAPGPTPRLFLAGRTAVVQGVFLDVDGDTHIAVTMENDESAQEFAWHGRYLYFHRKKSSPRGGGDVSDDETTVAADEGAPMKVLVAGVGNIFMTDDAFGVEVVQRLLRTEMPAGVLVKDFGSAGSISPTSCSTATTRWSSSMPCPATSRRDPFRDRGRRARRRRCGDGRSRPRSSEGPRPARRARRPIDRVLVVGCQPASVDDGMGLTEPFAAVVDEPSAWCGKS